MPERFTPGLLTSFTDPEATRSVSLTELTTWLRCKQQHAYAYTQALTAVSPPGYLAKGSYLHALMEQLLLTIRAEGRVPLIGELSNRALNALARKRAAGGNRGAVSEPDKREVDALVTQYLKSVDLAANPFEVVDVELEFLADLGWTSVEGEAVGYHGFIDAVLRDSDGSLWVVEHKTAARAWSLGQHQFAYQGRLYAAAYERLTGERPVGILYNFFYPKRFATELTYVTPTESALLVAELGRVVAGMGVAPVVREPANWGCGDCWFRNLCVTQLQGGDDGAALAEFAVDEEKLNRRLVKG